MYGKDIKEMALVDQIMDGEEEWRGTYTGLIYGRYVSHFPANNTGG